MPKCPSSTIQARALVVVDGHAHVASLVHTCQYEMGHDEPKSNGNTVCVCACNNYRWPRFNDVSTTGRPSCQKEVNSSVIHACVGLHKPDAQKFQLGDTWSCPTCGRMYKRINNVRGEHTMVWESA